MIKLTFKGDNELSQRNGQCWNQDPVTKTMAEQNLSLTQLSSPEKGVMHVAC